jgi:ornithine carbamoyltransferase
VHVSHAPGYEVDPAIAGVATPRTCEVFDHPMEACAGADLVTTDVWTSMGFEAENERPPARPSPTGRWTPR